MNNFDYNYRRPRPKRRSIFSYIIVALIAGMIGGLAALYVGPKYLYGDLLDQPQSIGNDANATITINTNEDISVVTAVASKSMSAVVGVTTLEDRGIPSVSAQMTGLGSGVVVHSDGYILTNSHVVSNGNVSRIDVLFEDGSQKAGKLLWNDSLLDLAIVKVEGSQMDVAELGNSDLLQVGELAVAIGNPLGLEFQRTVTSGVISGLHRSVRMSQFSVMEDLIQTDASINNGNSGGPLLNSKGQVIGVNTAKVQGGEGLGFAIPINSVKPIIENIIRDSNFSSVYIGFTGLDLEMFERQYGVDLPADSGAVVEEVLPNSPAANANIQPRDVILEMDGETIESMSTLRRLLLNYSLGDTARLTIDRMGEILDVEITFVEF